MNYLLALAAAALPFAAAAQTPPAADGIVNDPCVGLPVPVPPAITAYLANLYSANPPRTAPPAPPEAADYRKAAEEAAKRDWANLCRYRADNIRLQALPSSERRVVFLGDSITQSWIVAHPAFFTGGLVDRGISGQTTPQILLRFQADVAALRPQVVHIMAGTNDVAGNTGPTSAQDFRNNIMAMVALAKARGIRVILASIPPAASFSWKPGIDPVARIAELNLWLRDYAREQGLVWVDYHPALADGKGGMRPELTFDGVHPNAAGYAAMEPLTRQALAAAR